MSATTRNDRYTKHQLINDVLGIVIPPGFPYVWELTRPPLLG